MCIPPLPVQLLLSTRANLTTSVSLSENTMHTSITKTQGWTVMNYELRIDVKLSNVKEISGG